MAWRPPEGMAMNLNEWRDRVHALAREKGWHDDRDVSDPHVLGSMLALIHSEVSEALEDVRRGDRASIWYENLEGVRCTYRPASGGKPCGVPIELADVLIRTLDLCGALGIDIENAVSVKHAFNETRSHRHGGKAL